MLRRAEFLTLSESTLGRFKTLYARGQLPFSLARGASDGEVADANGWRQYAPGWALLVAIQDDFQRDSGLSVDAACHAVVCCTAELQRLFDKLPAQNPADELWAAAAFWRSGNDDDPATFGRIHYVGNLLEIVDRMVAEVARVDGAEPVYRLVTVNATAALSRLRMRAVRHGIELPEVSDLAGWFSPERA